ncbi:COX15/CtaA family protein [Catenovulum maritimum]|uniref:Cytochrome B561 n=1 Tax=Catenovulum maritimum TaxID=1513271 RepID=A0A0J8GSY0_9ALTE|nr:COX15/CtaA family protein [Catenovulum maritimum]KMT64394.1 hypothetical protein XM47_14530 [Catenovulum maritimum]
MQNLVRVSILLTLVVVILGAYTRLTDAGLGCPDWPGCYGHMLVPTGDKVTQAQSLYPDAPIEHEKAWNEMIHRYFAGTLGLLILAMTLISFCQNKLKNVRLHCSALLGVVTFQALLGMWTVTLSLMPIVVMAHLIGGFTTFILLVWLERRINFSQKVEASVAPIKPDVKLVKTPKLAIIALAVLMLQIMLGGWTSSNYAALVCNELPICQGDWVKDLAFMPAFNLASPDAETYQYGVLDFASRMTIHVTHRVGAIVTMLVVLAWLFVCFRNAMQLKQQKQNTNPKLIYVLGLCFALLLLQVSLGVLNIVLSLPLIVAVAHNAIALLLLASLFLSILYYRYEIQRVNLQGESL